MDNLEESYISEAKMHVEKNIVDAEGGRECVDGRYDQHGSESGFIARPGADFGYVMGLLTLIKQGKIQITPKEAVDKVYEAVTENGDRFYAHTDEHTNHEHGLSGCGHIFRSTQDQNTEKYDLNPEDVVTALTYMRERSAHQNVDEVELPGEHLEKGVLIIRGMDKTVDHHDENNMYFVYDADRDNDFQKELVEKMNIQGLLFEDFNKALEEQTNATVGILAKGKPIIEVDLNEKEPKYKFVAIA